MTNRLYNRNLSGSACGVGGEIMENDNSEELDLDEVLAADCPDCGQRGRGLSTCKHCGCFMGMSLSLPSAEADEASEEDV